MSDPTSATPTPAPTRVLTADHVVLGALILAITLTYGTVLSQPHLAVPHPVISLPPDHAVVTLDQLSTPVPNGSGWEEGYNTCFTLDAFIDLGRVWVPTSMTLSVDLLDAYSIYFFDGDRPRGEVHTGVVTPPCEAHGMWNIDVELPHEVRKGIDRLVIFGAGDGLYCVGDLQLREPTGFDD